ncbi:MAG: hypothetical protein QM756_32775 [Polyangiaceae bacterium]
MPSRVEYAAALLLLLSSPACLDIERTPAAAAGGAAGAASGTGELDPEFMPSACVGQCVEMTPAGAAAFSRVSACFDRSRAGECAAACESSATDAPASSCALPASIDPNPACNNCIKDHCCERLMECFGSTNCITIGICASGCGG